MSDQYAKIDYKNAHPKVKDLALRYFILTQEYNWLVCGEWHRVAKDHGHVFIAKRDCKKCTSWVKIRVTPIKDEIRYIRSFLRTHFDLNKKLFYVNKCVDAVHKDIFK